MHAHAKSIEESYDWCDFLSTRVIFSESHLVFPEAAQSKGNKNNPFKETYFRTLRCCDCFSSKAECWSRYINLYHEMTAGFYDAGW